MDVNACREVPADIVKKFKAGFPANFKDLISEAEAIFALQAADLQDERVAVVGNAAEAVGAGSAGQSEVVTGGSKQGKASEGSQAGSKGGQGGSEGGKRKRKAGKMDVEGEEKGKDVEKADKAEAVVWKNLNQMTVSDVGAITTSRSGRKLQKPCDFWRQQVPIYETVDGERQLVGVVEGEKDLTSSFISEHSRTPRTPVSGIIGVGFGG